MVATVQRTAVKPFKVEDGEKVFDLEIGKTYDTAKYLDDGRVFVFSRYWLWIPAECFGMGPREQRQAALEAAKERMTVAARELREANAKLYAAEVESRAAREALEALDSSSPQPADEKP